MDTNHGCLNYQGQKSKESSNDANSGVSTKTPVCIPYVRGLSEKLTRVFREHGVSTYHKPFNTIKSMLPTSKDKSPDDSKCGIIYECSVNSAGTLMSVRPEER